MHARDVKQLKYGRTAAAEAGAAREGERRSASAAGENQTT